MFFRSFITLFLIFQISLFSKEKFTFGVFHKETFVSAKEARIGAKLWLKQIEKSISNMDFKIKFYEREEELLNDYAKNRVSSVIVDTSFYYKNKKYFDEKTESKWILSRNKEIFEKFYLIKHVDSKFNLKNLATERILFNGEFAKEWGSLILNNRKGKLLLQKAKTEKSTMYDVFFNKNTTAVVNSDLYDLMVDLNPQIKEKIKIVKESDRVFFRVIGLTRKNLSKEKSDFLNEITYRVNIKDVDFGALSYVQVQKIFVLKEKDLDRLDMFYKKRFSKLK